MFPLILNRYANQFYIKDTLINTYNYKNEYANYTQRIDFKHIKLHENTLNIHKEDKQHIKLHTHIHTLYIKNAYNTSKFI